MATEPSSPRVEGGPVAEYSELLRAAPLTALMRETWTWDDRALRRDLADVLVATHASELLATSPWPDGAWSARHHEYTLTLASQLARSVLGSHLLTRDLAGTDAAVALAQDLALEQPDSDGGDTATKAFMATTGPRVELTATRPLAKAAIDAYRAALMGPNGTGRGLADLALAAAALRAVGADPVAEAALAKLNGGGTATLAIAERLGTWDPAMVRTRAETDGTGVTVLDGEKRVVPYVNGSQALLVMGRTTAGPTLYLVDPAEEGVRVSTASTTNPDAPFSTLSLRHVPATRVGRDGSGGRTMARVLDTAGVIIAGEQLGHAERSIEYLADLRPHDPSLPDLIASWAAAAVTWLCAVEATEDPQEGGIASAMSQIASGRAARSATRHALAAAGNGTNERSRRDRADALDLIFGGPATSHERLLERMDI